MHVDEHVEEHSKCFGFVGRLKAIHPRVSHIVGEAPNILIKPEHYEHDKRNVYSHAKNLSPHRLGDDFIVLSDGIIFNSIFLRLFCC